MAIVQFAMFDITRLGKSHKIPLNQHKTSRSGAPSNEEAKDAEGHGELDPEPDPVLQTGDCIPFLRFMTWPAVDDSKQCQIEKFL